MDERIASKAKGQVGAGMDAFLPYLFHLITAGLNARFLERLRPYGVTVQRWRVLMTIMDRGPRNIGQLGRLTLIPQSALSRLIDQMERDGLVGRKINEADSRVVTVELTDHGRHIYHQLAPVAALHADAIVKGFSDEERQALHVLLRRVLDNLGVNVPVDEGVGRKVKRRKRPV
jgi:DNA-binding MarR family transcriptional regulator